MMTVESATRELTQCKIPHMHTHVKSPPFRRACALAIAKLAWAPSIPPSDRSLSWLDASSAYDPAWEGRGKIKRHWDSERERWCRLGQVQRVQWELEQERVNLMNSCERVMLLLGIQMCMNTMDSIMCVLLYGFFLNTIQTQTLNAYNTCILTHFYKRKHAYPTSLPYHHPSKHWAS